jgi:integrase
MNSITQTNPTHNELITTQHLPLDRQPALVYLAGLNTQRSRDTQKQALEVLAELLTGRPDILGLDWGAIRYQHAQAIRAELAERYSYATANRILSALRGALKAAFLLGFMPGDDYTRAIMVKNVTGSTIPAGRELGKGEIAGLLAACENDPSAAGARDAAIIALMYSCGLRRAEVVEINLDDYNQNDGRLVVRGKRNKERTAYLVNGAKRAFADWLALRGDQPGPLFCPINKGGKLPEKTEDWRMTTQAVYNMLNKRGAGAGVDDFSPHDMRRTFVSDMLEAGADIATVAKMAGHASVNTTARYDRRPEDAKRQAAELLHVPYHGRLVRG